MTEITAAVQPRADRRAHPARRLAGWSALWSLASAVVRLRIAPAVRASLRAEDGAVFLPQAAHLGWRSLVEPYAGYLHTVPRLVALLVVQADATRRAQLVTAASCLVAGAVALLVGLTEVQAVVLAPLAAYRWRDRAGLPVRVGLPARAARRHRARPAPGEPRHAARRAGDRFVVRAQRRADHVVRRLGAHLPGALGEPHLLLGGLVALALTPSVLAWRTTWSDRVEAPAARLAARWFPPSAGALYVVSMMLNRPQVTATTAGLPGLTVLRYGAIAALLLAAGVLVVLPTWWRRGAWARRFVALGIAGEACTVLVSFQPSTTQRAQGPQWAPQVRTARAGCRADDAPVVLPLAPRNGGWSSLLTCADLTG